MTLREALFSRGEKSADVDDIIADMVAAVEAGEDPEDVLYSEGLEPDYVFDLLDEMT